MQLRGELAIQLRALDIPEEWTRPGFWESLATDESFRLRRDWERDKAVAGFAGISVTFTHQVGDGLHSAIIKATRPPDGTSAAAVPTAIRRELPVVQSGCC